MSEVLPTAPDGTVAFKYTQLLGFSANGVEFGAWTDPNQTVKPGEGFFLQNNAATPLTVTFVGEVPQGTLKTTLLEGLNLVSSQVPQAGKLQADLGYVPANGDLVYTYASTGYTVFQYDDEWLPSEPVLRVGEGIWVRKAAAGEWTRTFSVN
jgi:hypothetical protein